MQEWNSLFTESIKLNTTRLYLYAYFKQSKYIKSINERYCTLLLVIYYQYLNKLCLNNMPNLCQAAISHSKNINYHKLSMLTSSKLLIATLTYVWHQILSTYCTYFNATKFIPLKMKCTIYFLYLYRIISREYSCQNALVMHHHITIMQQL